MELINLKVLGGLTGSGKTEILHELLLMGEQVIDLESIACHRGSIFGNINGKSQPSINDFNESIAKNLKKINYNRPVWIEYKGQYIGKLKLPPYLIEMMQNSKIFNIHSSLEARIKRIESNYALDFLTIKTNIDKLRKRLRKVYSEKLYTAVMKKDRQSLIRLLIQYYDEQYIFQLKNWVNDNVIPFDVDKYSSIVEAANRIKHISFKIL